MNFIPHYKFVYQEFSCHYLLHNPEGLTFLDFSYQRNILKYYRSDSVMHRLRERSQRTRSIGLRLKSKRVLEILGIETSTQRLLKIDVRPQALVNNSDFRSY